MALYFSNGSSAETDWKLGSGCTVTKYYYQGTVFSSRYASPASSYNNVADTGVGFMQNGVQIRTLIGDKSYSAQQQQSVDPVGVGVGFNVGIRYQIP